ncbi:MAG: glycosyltransferase family 4 protein [Deltaproteobacteria bacterium]|nr:glycosyltransferase family 4 protein [Deltaproteobacteria bacterium]MBW2415868.1 glycosyltransferase family 4 protein [Deltaproteobacteria bacterium]
MPDPLRIVHVDSERGFSGGEVQVFLLMEGLRARGHHNVLICPPGSRCESEARERGIETLALPMRNYTDGLAVLRLRRALDTLRADLLHLHTGRATWLGGLAARWAGLPAITTRRMDRRVKRGWRTRLIYGWLVERAVAISPAVASRLEAGGVPASLVRTIRSSVDLGALEPAAGREATRKALGADPDAVVLLCLARLHKRKGIDVLLRALGGMSAKPRLWIAGDGPERGALEALARETGVDAQVQFLGMRSDAADLLAGCDVFVVPSRSEGLGVVALEAMAAARPVVASAVGGLAHAVVEGRTGLLVSPEDPDALARALARVIEDPALRESLGDAGPGRVAEGFLAEQMVEAYESLYFEVLTPAAVPRDEQA